MGWVGPITGQEPSVAHQEGAEEDEGDKVNIGQVGTAALALVLSRRGGGVPLTAFLPKARKHYLLPGLPGGTPAPETFGLVAAGLCILPSPWPSSLTYPSLSLALSLTGSFGGSQPPSRAFHPDMECQSGLSCVMLPHSLLLCLLRSLC